MSLNDTDLSGAVSFLQRFTCSEHFETLYTESISLIEESVNYIDGEGREQARNLDTPVALSYVAESMRLTNRLMHMASWLFIHKAFKDGEIDHKQFLIERNKLQAHIRVDYKPSEHHSALPLGLRSLIKRSIRMLERICALDKSSTQNHDKSSLSGVHKVMSRLNQAFQAH